MRTTIFESAKNILEASAPTSEQLASLTKLMLSMGASYGEINAVRAKLGNDIASGFLLNVAYVIANNTALFNSFVRAYKNPALSEESEIELTEDELAALNEDKLQNDIKSLKKIGWKLDKVQKYLITKGSDYGVKMTSDLIAMYYNEKDSDAKKQYVMGKDGKPMTLPGTNIKIGISKTPPKEKKAKWPSNPPKSKINDPSHAEAFLGQVFKTGESPDMTGTEAYQILTQAGYTEHATMWVIRNLGWEGDLRHGQGGTKIAKKTAPKFRS